MDERIGRINTIVEILDLTRYGLATASGINPSNLNRMLTGELSITDKTLNKICAAFPQVNREWLLNGEGDMLNPNISMVQNGDGGVHQQGHAGAILNQTANSEKMVLEFFDSMKAQTALTEKSMAQTDKVLEEISEQRKMMDRLISMLEKAHS